MVHLPFWLIVVLLALVAVHGLAQQTTDPAKLAPIYRQQRELQTEGVANCLVALSDLQEKLTQAQAKIAELEKAKQ